MSMKEFTQNIKNLKSLIAKHANPMINNTVENLAELYTQCFNENKKLIKQAEQQEKIINVLNKILKEQEKIIKLLQKN